MKTGTLAFTVLLGFSTLAACGGGATQSNPGCGFPPPVPVPWLTLAYPIPGATNVPPSIGIMLMAGEVNGFYGPDTVALASWAGSVPIGTFTAAPSPLPTPYATPAGSSGDIPNVAVPLPTLSPATTYTASFTYTDWADNPPSCRTQITTKMGSFKTQ